MSIEIYNVKPVVDIDKNKIVSVNVPGSKSITNRALLIAAMANGTSVLNGCLTSDDAAHFLQCLKTLGFSVKTESDGALGINVKIKGTGGVIPNKNAEIYVGSAGTAARFLAAMLAFSEGEYIINSSEQMKKRPMQPLIDTLRSAGADVICMENEGHFPLKIIGIKDKSLIPESITVNIDKSSQFLSALLIAAGTFSRPVTIAAEGSHGLSYVELTAEMMKSFGVNPEKHVTNNGVSYVFSGKERYNAVHYDIEPDMSAAAYFYAMAAILGAQITVKGVCENMLQGDTEFIKVLCDMGCTADINENGQIVIKGPEKGKLKGGMKIDMSSFSDQALTVAAIAPFADAPIAITGIGHIRFQECNRINAIVRNLSEMGIVCDEKEAAVTIYPNKPHGCNVETYDDHRVAMSFALTGLRTEDINIINPSCCQKTFAEYFDVLEHTLSELERN